MTDPNVNPSASPQPEYLSNEQAPVPPAASAPEAKRSKSKLVGGVAALATVAVIACGGAFAYSMLNSSDDYPYNHMADGAFAYVQSNMDPSAGQKLAINELTKKFPELKSEDDSLYATLTAENINAAFVKEALGSETQYDWVGDRVALAAYPDNDDEDKDPQIAVLIETTDAEAAKADLDAMLKEINGGPEMTEEDWMETQPETPVMPEEDPNSDLMLPEDEQPGGVDMINPDVDGDGQISPDEEELFKQYLESQGTDGSDLGLTPGTRPTNPDADGDGVVTPNEQALYDQMLKANEAVNDTNVNAASFVQEDPATPVMPSDVQAEEEFTGKVLDEKWVAVTDGDLASYFEAETSLADNSDFTDRLADVQGNVFSAYVNLDGFTEATELVGEGYGNLSGDVVATVEVRKDGVDMSAESFGVKADGKTVGPQGDASAVTDLLEANAYEDAAFNLAIAGLGDSVKNALESMGEEATVSLDEEVAIEDVPDLLGDKAAVSVKGNIFEDLEAKLILTGVDEAKWNEYLAAEGVSPEQLSEEASAELGRDFQFTIQDGELVALVGAAPEGGQDFEDGQVTGSVNLDDIASIIHNFTFFGAPAEGEAPTGLGTVTFHASTDENGNGTSMASWTTPR